MRDRMENETFNCRFNELLSDRAWETKSLIYLVRKKTITFKMKIIRSILVASL